MGISALQASLLSCTVLLCLEWKKCVTRKQNKKDPPPPPRKELNGSSRQEQDKQRSLQQWKTHCCTLPCSTCPHAGEPYKYISVSCATFTLALPKPFPPFCQGICTQLLVRFPLRNCSGQWFYLANLKHSWYKDFAQHEDAWEVERIEGCYLKL